MSQRRISPATWLPRVPIRQLIVYVDGSSVPNPGPSGFGLLVLARCQTGDWLFGCTKSTGVGGNNQAEFLGLVSACEVVRDAKPQSALILSDSTVGLGLLTGKLRAAGPAHRELQQRSSCWLAQSASTGLCWVPRSRNYAHHLARSAVAMPAGAEMVVPLGSSRSPMQQFLALAS